jgi:hypothetical protein
VTTSATATGVYVNQGTVAAAGAASSASPTFSGTALTQADVGKIVIDPTGSFIPAGTFITAVSGTSGGTFTVADFNN